MYFLFTLKNNIRNGFCSRKLVYGKIYSNYEYELRVKKNNGNLIIWGLPH
jgi:hypothetical protein